MDEPCSRQRGYSFSTALEKDEGFGERDTMFALANDKVDVGQV